MFRYIGQKDYVIIPTQYSFLRNKINVVLCVALEKVEFKFKARFVNTQNSADLPLHTTHISADVL